MTVNPPAEAYETAAITLAAALMGEPGYHPTDRDRAEAAEDVDWCRECQGPEIASLRAARLAVDAVWPLAEARGYARAVANLRDSQAYMAWVRDGQRAGTQPHRSSWGISDVIFAADYLEAIADAIDPPNPTGHYGGAHPSANVETRDVL